VNTPTDSLNQNTIGDYLQKLGDKTPTPGGGAAAALTLAQSCSLYTMALRISFPDPKHPLPSSPFLPGPLPNLGEILDHFDGQGTEFMALGDRDMATFEALMEAYRLPRETSEQKDRRRHQIQTQTALALKIPLKMATSGLLTLKWAPYAVYLAKPSIISDCAIATELLLSGIQCSLINIRINLKSLADKDIQDQTVANISLIEEEMRIKSQPLVDYCKKLLV
jgi:formiminotetrahydrofolate cyclodeaminase